MKSPPRRYLALGYHDRRSFLKTVGCAGLAAASVVPPAALLTAIGAAQCRRGNAGTRQPLIQPREIRSESGVLRATLTAAPGRVRLGDIAFDGFLYNGAYLPPLLRPRLGDTMRITFRNHLPDDPSNLHFHGMAVSPQGNSDNVFVHVHPGHQFDYEVRIPAIGRQRPGLYWYHPHTHGVVAKQMLGGMSGGLVVDGFETLFPIVRGLPEQFFFIKHAELGGDSEIISINGQLNPVVDIRPGEMQFWRIANIGATLFIKFKIEGMPLYVVATDGHPRSRPDRTTEFFVGPGQRIDAIAIGPQAGECAMRTISFQNQAWKDPASAAAIGDNRLRRTRDGGTARRNGAARSACRDRALDRRCAVCPDRSPAHAHVFKNARPARIYDRWPGHG